MEKKIYYTAFCSCRGLKIKIEITDIYRKRDDVEYRLEFFDKEQCLKRCDRFSLEFVEDDGEYRVFLMFSFIYGQILADKELRLEQIGKNGAVYYSFPINILV